MCASLALSAFTFLCICHRVHLWTLSAEKCGVFFVFSSVQFDAGKLLTVLAHSSFFTEKVQLVVKCCGHWVSLHCSPPHGQSCLRLRTAPSVSSAPPALVLAGFAAPSCPAFPPLLHLPFQYLPFAVFSPMPLSCSSRLPFPASSTLGPLHQYSLGTVPSEFKVLASSQNNLETK